MLCIRNGQIHDGIHRDPYVSDILIDNGRIVKIAANISADDCQVVDAAGLRIYPGFVEAHCHTGLSVYGSAGAGREVNESNDPVTPQLRAIDGIDPADQALKEAARAGVTCIATGPGSTNVIGGQFLAMKTWGECVDDMVVRDPVAMKCAFGENPKSCYGKNRISSRMTIAAILRDTLSKAQRYMQKVDAAQGDPAKLPPYDQKMEALLPVMRKEIPLKAHAHQRNDIFTAIRIAKEFDLKLTLEHVTEGHLIVDKLSKVDYPMAVGPSFSDGMKIEYSRRDWSTAGVLAKAGCRVSIVTDAPVIPLWHLPMCAGYAVKAGMDPFAALQAITINPARQLGIEDRVGSLEVGKDADLVLMDGSPFAIETAVHRVYINGSCIFEKKTV